MTSTASFKDRFKQMFSIFRWELQSCFGTIVVFTILAAAFMAIAFTLTMTLGGEHGLLGTLFGSSMITEAGSGASDTIKSISVLGFQFASAAIVYYLTIVFTIFYTVKVFSYLHNKRKADLYGSLPVSRITLFCSKAASAVLFSLVPAMFFMGIMSVISICMEQPIVTEVSQMYVKLVMGTIACVAAYSVVAVCCGTTINSVIMFITVCVAYPLSAMFIKGTIGGFFTGFYTGSLRNSFIMNALNPLAAYDGINIVYWIVFTIVCLVIGALLVRNRKAERAQSSFAYYIPCHVNKVLVAFLFGMLLGTLFGSLNVFGYGYAGFVFGFIMGSVPAFVICHLIFYKGFSKLVKTSIPLGALIVVVAAVMALCNFDVFGYNSRIPNADDVASAGFVDSQYCYNDSPNKNMGRVMREAAGDFSDKDTISSIVTKHNAIIKNSESESYEKFRGIWADMLTDNSVISSVEQSYAISYKLKSGGTITRFYSESLLSRSLLSSGYTDSTYDIDTSDIVKQKAYVQKYSGIENAPVDQYTSLSVVAKDKDNADISREFSVIESYGYGKVMEQSSKADAEKITKAFCKDLAEDNSNLDTVLNNWYSGYNSYLYDYSSDGYNEYNDSLPENVVCSISLSASNVDYSNFNLFSIMGVSHYSSANETYLIPSSYKNTIAALKDAGILNDDNTANKDSGYYNK